MARIVTVQILIDEDDVDKIVDGLNEMFRCAQQPVDEDDSFNWVIDWSFDGISNIHPDLEDAIVNGTYEEDDFTSDQYMV